MRSYEPSHDTYRDFIASYSRKLFGSSCIPLKEVPSTVGRADLVLVTRGPFPYVRIVEVKTRHNDYWSGVDQLLRFKRIGLANYYFIALPEKEIDYLTRNYPYYYSRLVEHDLGLLMLKPKRIRSGISIEVRRGRKSKFEVRKRNWEGLYKELEKIGEQRLIEQLRKTVGKTTGW
mgnify:CR=1 FL=1